MPKITEKKVIISANSAWNLFSRKRLLLALKEAGWTVMCLSNADEYAMRIESELGIEFIPVRMKGDGTKLWEDIRLFFAFINIYRKRHPMAVLHINNKPNIYGTIAASLLGIKSASNITGLGIVAEKTGLTAAIVYSLYRMAFSSKKAFVFFQNKEDKDFFLTKRLIDPDRTEVLPGSGVDISRYVPDPDFLPKSEDNAVTFLYNGRLLVSKGIGTFIQAARAVKVLYPNTVFTIIGEHDPSNTIFISEDILQEAVTSGLVRYYGIVSDVSSYIREADCVVLPSWYREGVPRALLEAAAMGKPLIAADSVGTRDPVENGRNGYLVRPCDASALVDILIQFIKLSVAEKGKMGSASRQIAENRFNDTIIIEAYLRRLTNIERLGV